MYKSNLGRIKSLERALFSLRKRAWYDGDIRGIPMVQTLKETLDTLPGGLLITDRESRVLYASSALERRTGFAVAEIVGKKPGQLWGGKMGKQFYQHMWQRIETEHRPFVGEVNNTHKNGARHDEYIFILPIHDKGGATQYFAEVHPELSGRESELQFGQEFLTHTERGVQDKQFFSWMFQRLCQKKDGSLSSLYRNFSLEGFQDGASFLRTSFIEPTEDIFSNRTEDAVLIALAQENGEFFGEVYTKYVGTIREYFFRRLFSNAILSEDLTQEVFVRAFRSLPIFRLTNASYATYLIRIAHNVLVNYYRQNRTSLVPLSGQEEAVIAEAPTVPVGLETLLQGLTVVEQQVMFGKYRDGLKIRAIADRLGKTENAVKLILSRTRKKLKKSLE